MTKKLSPIALFTFNRPQHTQVALESLLKNPQASASDLYVFSDGPRHERDLPGLEQTRAMLRKLSGFKHIELVFRDANMGLADSIIDGVSQLVSLYGTAIVLEDDLRLSPYFLQFMNEGLECYADEPRVCSIHGYCFPTQVPLPETFFWRGADCWGWATWARAWQGFEQDGQALLAKLQKKKLTQAFDLDGLVPYTQMLKDQIKGKNNSWAIRWHAATFLKEQLTLFPGRSLVNNIGNDASGQHCEQTDVFDTHLSTSPIKLGGISIKENLEAKEIIKQYYRSIKPSLMTKIVSKVQRNVFKKHGT